MSSNSEAADISRANQRALILVVERNHVVQRLERFFLDQPGYERAQELVPRILVTEILVPKLDGLSLCRALKADPVTSQTLVLIFSHLNAEDRAREVGADAFLVKPLSEQLLISTVEKLIALQERSANKNE